jgi:hypothetical protein
MGQNAVTVNGLQLVGAAAAATLTQAQWAVATGTANAILAAYPSPNTALTDGLLLAFRALGPNTIAAPTFAPDTLPPATIKARGGQALNVVSPDIPAAGAEMLVRYNVPDSYWELVNPGGG